MKQQKKERESNLKVWMMTAGVLFAVLGMFAIARVPKNDELNDIRAEIKTVEKQIVQEQNSQTKNSAYKQKFDVVSAEEEARDKFLKVIPAIYTKRKFSSAKQKEEFSAWTKIFPGKEGKNFIKNNGDSYGYLRNKSTNVYFGDLTDVSHTKITVVTLVESANKKEVTYGWDFDYNLKTQRINSFKEINIERN